MAKTTKHNSGSESENRNDGIELPEQFERDDRANSTIDAINTGSDHTIDSANSTGTGADTGTGIDPYESAGLEPAEPAIKRARKPRTPDAAKRKKTASKSVDLNDAARALVVKKVVGVHMLADTLLGVRGLCAITPEQGKELTDAVFTVCEQYDLSASPKLIAWGNLVAVMGMIYAPKIMMVKMMRAEMARRESEPPIKPAEPQNTGAMQFA